MRVPSIPNVAYIVGGLHVHGAEALSQSQPCVSSYFKGGVESWRVARPKKDSRWGLGLLPQAPRSTGHTASAPGPNLDTDLWDRGITINQPWGPPRWWHRMTATQTHTAQIQNRFTCTVSVCIHIYPYVHTSTQKNNRKTNTSCAVYDVGYQRLKLYDTTKQ